MSIVRNRKDNGLTRKGEATRGKLLAAAEEVFGTARYHGASISDITRLAGVAQGTFYVYFPSKLAIFRELVTDLGNTLRKNLAMAVSGLDDRLAVERAGIRAFISFIKKHKYLYRVVREAEAVDEELYRWYYRTMAEGYSEGLARAARRGQIRDLDPEAVAYALMGVSDFLGMRWVLWEDREPPERYFEATIGFIERGLRPDASNGGGGRGRLAPEAEGVHPGAGGPDRRPDGGEADLRRAEPPRRGVRRVAARRVRRRPR